MAWDPVHEGGKRAAIYVERGLDPELASTVDTELMQHDALGAPARDELDISDAPTARPVQATLASDDTSAVGALLPLLIVVLVPASALIWAVSDSALLFLALLGVLAARTGGARDFGCFARHVLGRFAHGVDGWSWGARRGSGLIFAVPVMSPPHASQACIRIARHPPSARGDL